MRPLNHKSRSRLAKVKRGYYQPRTGVPVRAARACRVCRAGFCRRKRRQNRYGHMKCALVVADMLFRATRFASTV